MHNRIYTIRDNKAGETIGKFLQLHRHDVVAIRTFGDLVTDTNSMFNKHPDDYELWQLGELDNDNNRIVGEPRLVITAREVLDQIAELDSKPEPLNLIREAGK